MKKIYFLLMSAAFYISAFAQTSNDTSTPVASSNEDDTYKKMIEYSRPGRYHKLLENLEGDWTYKGQSPDSNGMVAKVYYGTFIWKSFADGRYFTAEGRSSKIQMPVQNGKMKEVNYKCMYTMGYNNVKGKFEVTTIANVLGSNITFAEGTYDSTTKAITFDSEDSPVPGLRMKNRDVFTFRDKDHYTLESYTYENEKYIKINLVKFTRVKKVNQ